MAKKKKADSKMFYCAFYADADEQHIIENVLKTLRKDKLTASKSDALRLLVRVGGQTLMNK